MSRLYLITNITGITGFFKRYDKIIGMKKQKDYMDLCTDYLISVQGEVTATGLSGMLKGEVIPNHTIA